MGDFGAAGPPDWKFDLFILLCLFWPIGLAAAGLLGGWVLVAPFLVVTLITWLWLR